jgi:hypothetical protein
MQSSIQCVKNLKFTKYKLALMGFSFYVPRLMAGVAGHYLFLKNPFFSPESFVITGS